MSLYISQVLCLSASFLQSFVSVKVHYDFLKSDCKIMFFFFLKDGKDERKKNLQCG